MNSQDVILGLLHKKPLSGYEIKGLFEFPLGFFFDASFGTIYPTLAKLESSGFISKESVVQDNRPNKNVYRLTEAGRNRFREYMNSPLEQDLYRSDLMVRLFFAEFVGTDRLAEWLTHEIEEAKRQLKQLEDLRISEPDMPSGSWLCLQVGIDLIRAKAKALEEGMKRVLAEGPASKPDEDSSNG